MVQVSEVPCKVTAEHQAKLAYVYVRQSSVGQVTHHRESTDLQYQLVTRGIQLGWPRESVKVIDEDLGKSGTSATERQGFQYLMAEIGLSHVGVVISFDASRLARNNCDWYQLLELCGVFGTLIADSERIYDPNQFTDRLLLGLSGMMSEAEVHQIKRRLHAGAWNKAKRGELHHPLPVGLSRLPTSEVILHPDEEIQVRIRLVFKKFEELRSARAVRRYLREKELLLPSRPLRGPAPHEVYWQSARTSMVLSILKNPAYAGAYVHGRQTVEPRRRKPSHPSSGIVRRAIDQWPIVIQDVYPAYIGWERFLANQARLSDNQNKYQGNRPGSPRKGQALLQGIIRCARCGALMRLGYSGPHGQFPVYRCEYADVEHGLPRCQEVRGLGLDAEVERLLLQALEPDQIALALAGFEEMGKEQETLKHQQELHLQRLDYEAQRARRQYDAVEPENRLVARTLERSWEEKLRALEKAKQEHQSWLSEQRLELSAEDREDILALGADLPKVWHASSTTAAERKQILRYIIKQVSVDQKRRPGCVWFKIVWQTGAATEHWYGRRVRSYTDHAETQRIDQRIRELHAEGKLDDEIAETLNTEGLLTSKKRPFNHNAIWFLRKRLGLRAVKPNGVLPARWEDGAYSVRGASEAVGVYLGTIHKWLRTGRIHGDQPRKGTPWRIFLTEDDIEQLCHYAARVRRSQ
jgi:DNA invertase Pin-like site-specific DNA recombinase